MKDVGRGKKGLFLFLDPVKTERVIKHEHTTQSQFCVGPRTLKLGTETLEATGAELLLMDPEGRWSISVRLVWLGSGATEPGWENDTVVWRWKDYADLFKKCRGPSTGREIRHCFWPCANCVGHRIFSRVIE